MSVKKVLTIVGTRPEAIKLAPVVLALQQRPDQFDFDQPVRVTVNGRVAFDGMVDRDVETLLRWAARDNDRTMLFAAGLEIDAAGGS